MNLRTILLRANGLFLIGAGLGGARSDLAGAFLGSGPIARVLEHAPHAAIGFVEAHGLAVILGVLLLLARPSRLWHATGAAVHILLGASNLAFWPIFAAADMVVVGYLTTALHGVFLALQLVAALTFRPLPVAPAATAATSKA